MYSLSGLVWLAFVIWAIFSGIATLVVVAACIVGSRADRYIERMGPARGRSTKRQPRG